MDTIKILLGITVALLVGALAMSWKDFRRDTREAPKEELAEVQRQIAEIQRQQELLKIERERILIGEVKVPETTIPDETPALPEATPDIVEAPPTEVPMPEFTDPSELDLAPPVPSDEDMEKRAEAIKNAPVVARISEWISDPDIGSFATLEIIDAASVQAGTTLCLRRNSGILGRLGVSEVTPEGALANAISQFGEIKPEVGDELILEPVSE